MRARPAKAGGLAGTRRDWTRARLISVKASLNCWDECSASTSVTPWACAAARRLFPAGALPIFVFLAAEVGDARDPGQRLSQELQALGLDLRPDCERESRDVTAGTRDALNESLAHGIGAGHHDDGDGRGQGLGCPQYQVAGGHDHVRFEADELGDDVPESLEPSLGRPALEDEVLPFDVAEGPQALHERSSGDVDGLGSRHLRDRRRGEDEADAVDLPCLLRPGGKRRGEEAQGERDCEPNAEDHHAATAVCWLSTVAIFRHPSIRRNLIWQWCPA
jgi:hypothetical protein